MLGPGRGLTRCPPCPQVRSPVSDSILGEQTLVVSEEKVTVTELRAQLVAGLALALRTEPGHPGVVTATCQATGSLRTPKQVRGEPRGGVGVLAVPGAPLPSPASWQEATLSVWLSFSDGTLAPLELYGWQDVALAVASQDPAVVTVAGGLPGAPSWRPRVLAEGPGRGALLQLSLHPPDACRRGR